MTTKIWEVQFDTYYSSEGRICVVADNAKQAINIAVRKQKILENVSKSKKLNLNKILSVELKAQED